MKRHNKIQFRQNIQYVAGGPIALDTAGKNLVSINKNVVDDNIAIEKPVALVRPSKSSASITQTKEPRPRKELPY